MGDRIIIKGVLCVCLGIGAVSVMKPISKVTHKVYWPDSRLRSFYHRLRVREMAEGLFNAKFMAGFFNLVIHILTIYGSSAFLLFHTAFHQPRRRVHRVWFIIFHPAPTASDICEPHVRRGFWKISVCHNLLKMQPTNRIAASSRGDLETMM